MPEDQTPPPSSPTDLPLPPEAAKAVEVLQQTLKQGVDLAWDEFAPGVARLGVVFVNVYALNAGDGKWFLVDTGLPGFAGAVRAACEERFDGRPPEGILLTHAHFDHAGNAEALAADWNVPVYAHPLEMPYLIGESDYPAADPTPGGAICFLSRFFPTGGYDLRGRVELRGLHGGEIPSLPGWRWLHTPGHTVGHVSLFRDYDKVLIAGDALATVDLDSWQDLVRKRRQISRPATPFTPDWPAAKASVAALAALDATTVAAGHGLPLWGRYVAGEVSSLANTLHAPEGGRYADSPPQFDEDGRVVDVPPPAEDPLKPKLTLAAGLGIAGVAAAAYFLLRNRGGRA